MAEVQLVKGCCPLDCQDGCAWVAHVADGRVDRVTGAKDHPFTRGVLCAKVRDYQTRAYAPDRILHPLRRTGLKGAGVFERISWDDALDTIAQRFAEIVRRDGPEALMPLHDMGSIGVLQRRSLMRLFHALGASRIHGSVCSVATNAIVASGHPVGFDPEDIAESELILLWGANLLTTCHHHWHFCQEARKRRGARLVAVDPRKTRTAELCDSHLAIRPGTDAILAAGIAHIMLKEGLANLAYANQVAVDVDAFIAEVEPWTTERVAAACGLNVDDIINLALAFGRARPATIRSGVGPQQSVGGDGYMRAISALAILGGHWRHKGGGLFVEAYPRLDNKAAERPDIVPGNPRSFDLARLGQTLTDVSLAPPIKGLMIWGTNPAVSQADVETVWRGLAREDLFVVSLEHFMTDTARYADILLPSTTQLEHFDVQGAWGHHYIAVNHPAIAPIGEAKPHAEIMRLLAARMGLTHPALQESDDEIAKSALPEDIDLGELKTKGWIKASPARPNPTLNGQRLVMATGIRAPDSVDPGSNSTQKERLQLLTPKSHYFLNSTFANMERQRKNQGQPVLQMNSADARARGVTDGGMVMARNGRAALRVALQVTDNIRPGTVALEGKWWRHPAETAAVANRLVPGAWSKSGQPAYNDIFVDVEPVK